MSYDPPKLAEAVVAGERRALARLITLVENDAVAARPALRHLFPRTGRARVLGITGAPGVGKSSLVDRLIAAHRAVGLTVAVVAVDPTSPFTGGAILGDRIRMQRQATDPGVFIRSLATRGYLGGLSRSTAEVVSVLDAFGFDIIIVETVGTGQAEVDIVQLAHTTVVVTVPGLGDEIQAIKAGVLEIADVFVVNKGDLPGAERTVRELESMLDLGGERLWRPPVVTTVAREDEGISNLIVALAEHRGYLESSGQLQQKQEKRMQRVITDLVIDLRAEPVLRLARETGQLAVVAAEAARRRLDPYSAATRIVEEYRSKEEDR